MATTPLFLHVTTVLYAEGTDPQVVDPRALPSRVVAATPSGPLLKLMQHVGESIEVEVDEGAPRPSREQALLALRSYLASRLGSSTTGFDLVESGADEIPSIPRGNTYIRPFGPDLGPESDFAFGFPVGRTEVMQDQGAFDAVLKNPPLVEGDAPRIWARYHVILSNVPPLDPTRVSLEEVQREEERARLSAQSESHGRERYRLTDGILHYVEGLFEKKGLSNRQRVQLSEEHESEQRFVRMFGTGSKDVLTVSSQGPRTMDLDKVARAMVEPRDTPRESDLPAGYAFFGQFLTHEITRAEQSGLGANRSQGSLPGQLGTPWIDMRSLYGEGPATSASLFESDGVHMRVGRTHTDEEHGEVGEFDLPRLAGESRALIADARNDGNLAVAQTHVAMIRFHNAVVDHLLEQGVPIESCFEEAQKEVQRSVQAVTWHDFLRRLCHAETYADARARVSTGEGYQPRDWRPEEGDPGMPVEFSVAAFRLGHSLIKSEYEWNGTCRSRSSRGAVDMHQLFRMTGGMGLGGHQRLPHEWRIDWKHFVPKPEGTGAAMDVEPQSAGALDAYTSAAMHSLPPHLAAIGNLPKLNLMRGDRLALPSGEYVESEMALEREHFDAIGEDADPVGAAIKSSFRLSGATPLWLYVLREAELLEGGRNLGEVGSRIVLDTLGVLIDRSPNSIFRDPEWQPSWTSVAASELEFGHLLIAGGLMR